MIALLHIENIAVIVSADIRFDAGFNALTGETGAGKSIVIDAIGAVIGERTSRDLIRTGAKSALVEAVFTQLPNLPWFEENGMAPDEDGSLILRREIHPDGKNTCRLGGRLLTVSQLKALGSQLVNIHGQHDGQQLLDERCHLSYLDSFGGTADELEAYQRAYSALTEIRREMDALRMDEAERARRIDSLNYQIAELERAQLKAGEEAALTERRTLLRNAGKLIEAVERACFALSGDEDQDGAAVASIDGGIHVFDIQTAFLQFLQNRGESAGDIADFQSDHIVDADREIFLLQHIIGFSPVVDDEAEDSEILGIGEGQRGDVDARVREGFAGTAH